MAPVEIDWLRVAFLVALAVATLVSVKGWERTAEEDALLDDAIRILREERGEP